MQDLVRLSKLMSEQGLCSRREADRLIEEGLVRVDGEIIRTLGTKVSPDARIELTNQGLKARNQAVTILLNKPIGYVSSQPEDDYEPAVRLIQPETQLMDPTQPRLERKHFDKLAVAGRLDIDSQGLLVFTQDGRIAKQLVGADSKIEKEYLVRVDGPLSHRNLALLNHGLSLDGRELKPAKVEWLNSEQLRFILQEGRKRQIRRMCEMVGLRITGLKRVRIGQVMLGHLPEGSWRFLNPDERF